MSIIVVGYLNSVTDPDKMAAYREVAGAALAKHGGRVASVTSKPERLEGGMETPHALAPLVFPSAEAARAWREDPELAQVHALREARCDMSIFIGGEA